MSFLITVLQKVGNLLRALVRIIRKLFCCRRRQSEADILLPLTSLPNNTSNFRDQCSDFGTWDNWDDGNSGTLPSNTVTVNIDDHEIDQGEGSKNTNKEDENHEDFFKDMIPQFRKAKKIIINKSSDSTKSASAFSSRLSMDSRAFLNPEAELGVLTDAPLNWEIAANLEDVLDPESVIKENKLAEREKRLAEHQRRKQEKENKRGAKPTVPNVQSCHSSSDKTKDS